MRPKQDFHICHELDFSVARIAFIFLERSQSLYHIFFHCSSIPPHNLRVFMNLGQRAYHQKDRVNWTSGSQIIFRRRRSRSVNNVEDITKMNLPSISLVYERTI